MIYEVDDMIDDSSGRGKVTKYKVNLYYFGTFWSFWGKNHQIDLEMIYEVNDMIDDNSGRGKDTRCKYKLFGEFVVLSVTKSVLKSASKFNISQGKKWQEN